MAMASEMDAWALTEWNRPFQKIKLPKPKPQGTEILIKVTHAGLCHSDLHNQEGFYDIGKGQRLYAKNRGVELPMALGHEILGEVAELGPDVAGGTLSLGSSQVVYPWLGCGSCTRCSQQEDSLCPEQRALGVIQHGGFAEYVVVPDAKYLFELGDLDPAVACTFGCSGITALNAVSKIMPLPPNEPVVLIGAGGLGLAAISVLKSHGHKAICSVDVADDKLVAAEAAGATRTVNSSGSDEDAVKKILAATGGPVIAVIDFVNNSKTASMVNNLIAKGAKWVQVGVMGGSIELSLVGNIFKGVTIYSNIVGNRHHLEELMSLAKEGTLSPVPVQKMPWDSLNEATELLKHGKVRGRIILVK